MLYFIQTGYYYLLPVFYAAKLVGFPSNVEATSLSLLPTSSSLPPGRNSEDSSRRVMASRRATMCRLLMQCSQWWRAGPSTTTSDLLGRGTCISMVTGGGEAGVGLGGEVEKVSVVCERRLRVTKRSPHSQLSSRCGSMAEPRSGW